MNALCRQPAVLAAGLQYTYSLKPKGFVMKTHKPTWLLPMLIVTLLTGAPGTVGAQSNETCYIPNIDVFLEQCPTTDPAFEQIISDFRILKDSVDIDLSAISCTAPISEMPNDQITQELELVQILRILFYLDKKQFGHLPWTSLTLYDWLDSKVDGFNFDSNAAGSSCCRTGPEGDGKYVSLAVRNKRTQDIQAPNILLFAGELLHEARHVDGFGHLSGCCIKQGRSCDPDYDESNLGAYGVQYWFARALVDGTLNTGYSCWSTNRANEFVSSLRTRANNIATLTFCAAPPPVLDESVSAPCIDCEPPPTVIAADDGPYTVPEGGALVRATSILDNDTAPDKGLLTPMIVDPPVQASFFEVRPDGTFDYTHDGSETVDDTFTYRVSDGVDESEIATVLLDITPVNDAPAISLLGDGTITLVEGDTFNDPGATASDSEDGDISQDIMVGGDTVNTSVPGTYVISYNVADSDGSPAAEAVRTVVVNTAPAPPKSTKKGGGFLSGWEVFFLLVAQVMALWRKVSLRQQK